MTKTTKAFRTFGVAAAVLAGSAFAASAATLSVVSADCDPSQGATGNAGAGLVCTSDPARNDSGAVNLGAGDGSFYSLGLEGALIVEIDPAFTSPLSVLEVTNANSNHKEAASVWGSIDNITYTLLGNVTNQNGGQTIGGVQTLTFAGAYNFLMFVDISKSLFANSGTTDGFDLDAISVSEVPIPAALGLFVAGVAGLGAMRKRRALAVA